MGIDTQHQTKQWPECPVHAADNPNEAVPQGSPLMAPIRPKLEPSPSPPPTISPAQAGLNFTSVNSTDTYNCRKVRLTSGDAVLIDCLGNGHDPKIARRAGCEGLLSGGDNVDDDLQYSPADGHAVNRHSLGHPTSDAVHLLGAPTPAPAGGPSLDVYTQTLPLQSGSDHSSSTAAISVLGTDRAGINLMDSQLGDDTYIYSFSGCTAADSPSPLLPGKRATAPLTGEGGFPKRRKGPQM